MKSRLHSAVTLLVVMVCCATMAYTQGTTITLLHVNDSHAHLDAGGPKDATLEGTLGGIAKAATVFGTVRATEPNVLLLHAGDIFQGDPVFNTYFGVPELQLMQSLGFDAMTIGNHEFGYGPDLLASVLSAAFPGGQSMQLLSANLDMTGYPVLQTWIQPSMIKTVGGVKIGIFGMTTPYDPTTFPDPVIISTDLGVTAQTTAAMLRAGGAEVVICLSHLGSYVDRSVAAATTGIDFIVSGHDHYLFEQPVLVNNAEGKTVPIVQAGEHYEHVGKLRFTVDHGSVTMDNYTMLNVDATVKPDESVQGLVEQLKQGVTAKFGDLYHTVIGRAMVGISKKFDTKTPLRDTPMGNLVTDAFRKKTGTELAITALGLISEGIAKGPIVGADVFRSMSYGYDPATGLGFQLATGEIVGVELVKGMELGLSQLEVSDDLFLQFSGMRFSYDPQKQVGARVDVKSIHINGRKFMPLAKYTVTVNSFIVAILGVMGVSMENIQVLPDFEYAVVKDYIAGLGEVTYHEEGRIREQRGASLAKGDSRPSHGKAAACRLNDNYPNPFNPSTTISYALPFDGNVSITIFNILGQRVATLSDGWMPAGEHAVVWNASAMPSGVYFARMSAEGFHAIKKLHLVK